MIINFKHNCVTLFWERIIAVAQTKSLTMLKNLNRDDMRCFMRNSRNWAKHIPDRLPC